MPAPRDPSRRVRDRRLAYRRCLLQDTGLPTADGDVVLKDLARFCRAHHSTSIMSRTAGVIDPIASAQAEGRREVWLRILEHLHLEDRFIVNLREIATND